MLDGRSVLALIPARGGSKGLPGKNILQARGRPLLAWSVAAAQASRFIDRVVLSSEDEAIMAAARACGCEVPFQRPNELASDATPTIDVVLHALDALPGYDVVILLQPTSPLRTAADIDAACERFVASGASACVSVSRAEQSPYWMFRLVANNALVPIIEAPLETTRRQDLPEVYVLNGAIYVADAALLRQTRTFLTRDTVAHVMPTERSLDIDTESDFQAFKKMVAEDVNA
ncbi:MAG: acylneuraminate cytidylyltransferase family protein [Proteobacteria bacterium]|nr:acylneuraminate cytidylyltransferase family protein [Pseudomonadota bacterium]